MSIAAMRSQSPRRGVEHETSAGVDFLPAILGGKKPDDDDDDDVGCTATVDDDRRLTTDDSD